MFQIGEFSKLTKVTIKTLRYYDKIGLLKPAFVDPATGYRYYTDSQIETVGSILLHRSIGLSNHEIVSLLGQKEPTRALLQAQRQRLTDTIQQASRQIQRIDDLLATESAAPYQAVLKTIDSCTVYCCQGYIASLAHLRSYISHCAQEFRRAYPHIAYGQPDYCCVIYPEESYRSENIFVEYAQCVETAGEDSSIIKFRQLESITAVCVEHRGPYEDLRNAYCYAVQWAAAQGWCIDGSARERYIHGDWDRDDPADWLTEIQLPLRKKETETI